MYKFLKLDTVYRVSLRAFYKQNPSVIEKNYEESLSLLLMQGYGTSNWIEQGLNKFGVETATIISNDACLQQKWATEHGVSGGSLELLLAQIKDFSPDVLHVCDFYEIPESWLQTLRKKIPSIKLILGFCCSPYSEENIRLLKACDYTIICSRLFKKDLENRGLKTFEINHGFEETILSKIKPKEKTIDVSFVGSIAGAKNLHSQRQIILETLVKEGISIDFYGNIQRTSLLKVYVLYILRFCFRMLRSIDILKLTSNIKLVNKVLSGFCPRRIVVSKGLYRNMHTPVFGMDMFQLLSESKISLNTHGDIAIEYAANMRLFEVTGVGSCLVTDWKKNIGDFFIDGEECLTYKTPQECAEKIRWLLDNPKRCSEIAKKGQERCLRDHTIEKRAMRLHQWIGEIIDAAAPQGS